MLFILGVIYFWGYLFFGVIFWGVIYFWGYFWGVLFILRVIYFLGKLSVVLPPLKNISWDALHGSIKDVFVEPPATCRIC